ncbi:hypothetical protein [Bradyrhizobium sp. RDI18]|uniref:hypothetical protein n=1 Tax=Bradyrhizobium sp. RDI18 TaxID=3367400 RepID=UPI00371964F1
MVTLIERMPARKPALASSSGPACAALVSAEQRRGEGDAFHLSSVPWGVEVDPAADLKASQIEGRA